MKTLLALLLVLLAACSPSTMIENIADDTKERIARTYLQRLANGDAALSAEFEPSLRTDSTPAQLERMREVLPVEAPAIVNLVGYQVHHSSAGRRYNLTYQFGYGSRWVLSNVAWLETSEGNRQIVGMSAHQLKEPLQETHAFTLKRASLQHYAFLIGTVSIPTFVLVTLITCIRTKMPRRKWLWILFILAGIGSLSLNWTTGQIGFKPISLLLFGASAMTSSIYSPWVVSIACPLGAILFWFKRRKLRPSLATGAPSALSDTTPVPPAQP